MELQLGGMQICGFYYITSLRFTGVFFRDKNFTLPCLLGILPITTSFFISAQVVQENATVPFSQYFWRILLKWFPNCNKLLFTAVQVSHWTSPRDVTTSRNYILHDGYGTLRVTQHCGLVQSMEWRFKWRVSFLGTGCWM